MFPKVGGTPKSSFVFWIFHSKRSNYWSTMPCGTRGWRPTRKSSDLPRPWGNSTWELYVKRTKILRIKLVCNLRCQRNTLTILRFRPIQDYSGNTMIFLSRFGTMPISCGLVPFLSFHQPMGKGLEFVTLCYYGIVHCALCLVRGPTTWSLSHCLYIAL